MDKTCTYTNDGPCFDVPESCSRDQYRSYWSLTEDLLYKLRLDKWNCPPVKVPPTSIVRLMSCIQTTGLERRPHTFNCWSVLERTRRWRTESRNVSYTYVCLESARAETVHTLTQILTDCPAGLFLDRTIDGGLGDGPLISNVVPNATRVAPETGTR